jgi:hypothetical protein
LTGLAALTAIFVAVPHLVDGVGEAPMLWIAVVFYTVLAGSTVIAPIVAYAVAGERVEGQIERAKNWMQREHASVTAAIPLVVGVLLIYTGIRAL